MSIYNKIHLNNKLLLKLFSKGSTLLFPYTSHVLLTLIWVGFLGVRFDVGFFRGPV